MFLFVVVAVLSLFGFGIRATTTFLESVEQCVLLSILWNIFERYLQQLFSKGVGESGSHSNQSLASLWGDLLLTVHHRCSQFSFGFSHTGLRVAPPTELQRDALVHLILALLTDLSSASRPLLRWPSPMPHGS